MMEQLVGLSFLKKNEIKNKTCDMGRPFAFISYSHDTRDTQIVRNIFHTLYRRGYNLWIDTANMPHTERAWTTSAMTALVNKNCAAAFFFRSETSMVKDTILDELDTASRLDHVKRIVTVDIWEKEGNSADKWLNELLNSGKLDKAFVCKNICKIVDVQNSAIRLAEDAQNDIHSLADFIAEELEEDGVYKAGCTGGGEETGDPPDLTDPPDLPDPPETETISLPDFLKKYNVNTFKKETFQRVRLVGQGAYAAYSTPFFDSVYPVVWSFVMKLLEEKGEKYLHFVNEKNSGSKNPPFITAAEHQKRKDEKHPVTYRRLELPGLEGWSMCRHYGQYGWVNDVLRRRILELGMPLNAFAFAYAEPNQVLQEPIAVSAGPEESVEPEPPVEPDAVPGGVTSSLDLHGTLEKQGRKAPKKDSHSFTLYGEACQVLRLKDMILTVFKTTLHRHPEKLDLLLKNLPCLAEGFKISSKANPTIFRGGDTIEVNGRNVSIGTSMNYGQAQSYMKKLMLLCGEPEGTFVVDDDDC